MPEPDKTLMFIRCPSCLMHDADPPLRYDAEVDEFSCSHCGYHEKDPEKIESLINYKKIFYPQLKVRKTFGLP